jgi:hypothetical protein
VEEFAIGKVDADVTFFPSWTEKDEIAGLQVRAGDRRSNLGLFLGGAGKRNLKFVLVHRLN